MLIYLFQVSVINTVDTSHEDMIVSYPVFLLFHSAVARKQSSVSILHRDTVYLK